MPQHWSLFISHTYHHQHFTSTHRSLFNSLQARCWLNHCSWVANLNSYLATRCRMPQHWSSFISHTYYHQHFTSTHRSLFNSLQARCWLNHCSWVANLNSYLAARCHMPQHWSLFISHTYHHQHFTSTHCSLFNSLQARCWLNHCSWVANLNSYVASCQMSHASTLKLVYIPYIPSSTLYKHTSFFV